jgi:hypothetical protein
MLDSCGSLRIEREAQRLAALLLVPQGTAPADAAAGDASAVELQSIAVDTPKPSRPRTLGVEAVGLWAMAPVDFVEVLERLDRAGRSVRLCWGHPGTHGPTGLGAADPAQVV